jgi:nucleoside-diphosphate-sugar epimerase
VRRLAETIAALCQTELVVYRRPPRGGEVEVSIGNPRRAAEELGFRANTVLTDGLAATLAAFGVRERVKASPPDAHHRLTRITA